MSRLIDKFNKATKSTAQPMGFRTSRAAAPEPGLFLIVKTAPDILKNHSDINSAAAVLIKAEGEMPAARNISKMIEGLEDVPAGLYLQDADDEGIAAMIEAGCDYFIFPASVKVFTVPDEKKTGRIIEIESAMDDSLLRAVNSLPVDAAMVADTFTGGAMSWHELMIFQHLANTIAKPLIINIPADIADTELKALFEAGADGVVVDASALKPGGLKKLQELIGKLPPRSARKRGKVDATLPRGGGVGAAPQAPPDEEEEEDE
jgi:hypothetical protein